MLVLLATPLLALLYAGQVVTVLDMLLSILQIIIVPVGPGVLLNHYLQRQMAALRKLFQMMSVFSIVIIIAIVVALNRHQLAHLSAFLVAAVLLHNTAGLPGGYRVPRWLGRNEQECRTLAIEVGMQNSGLAGGAGCEISLGSGCLARCPVQYLAQPKRVSGGGLLEPAATAIVFQRSFSRRCSRTM